MKRHKIREWISYGAQEHKTLISFISSVRLPYPEPIPRAQDECRPSPSCHNPNTSKVKSKLCFIGFWGRGEFKRWCSCNIYIYFDRLGIHNCNNSFWRAWSRIESSQVLRCSSTVAKFSPKKEAACRFFAGKGDRKGPWAILVLWWMSFLRLTSEPPNEPAS